MHRRRPVEILEEDVWFSSDLNLAPIIILAQHDQGPGVVSVNCGKRNDCCGKTRDWTSTWPSTPRRLVSLVRYLPIRPSCRPVPDPIPHRYFSAENSSTLMPRWRAVAAKVCGLPNLNAQLKTRELAGANDE